MSSILTNVGAMTALRTLQNTNKSLASTQDRVATGMKVGNAKHNAATWSVASSMRAEQTATRTVIDTLGVAQSAVSLARGAAEKIVDTLEQLKAKKLLQDELTAAGDTTNANRVGAEIDQLGSFITQAVTTDASFNGINLVDGGGSVNFTINESGQTFTVNNADLNSISITSGSSLADIETALGTAQAGAAALGASQNRLEAQQEFAKLYADALKEGIGSLVDADMTEESARLQALQVQQQLGVQALSIANQAPQAIMGLFR